MISASGGSSLPFHDLPFPRTKSPASLTFSVRRSFTFPAPTSHLLHQLHIFPCILTPAVLPLDLPGLPDTFPVSPAPPCCRLKYLHGGFSVDNTLSTTHTAPTLPYPPQQYIFPTTTLDIKDTNAKAGSNEAQWTLGQSPPLSSTSEDYPHKQQRRATLGAAFPVQKASETMHPLSQVYTAPVAPSTDNTTSTSPNAIVDCSDEARKNGLTTQSDTNIPSPSGVSSHSATPSLIAGSRDGDHSDNVDSQPATSPVTPSPEMIIIPDDDDKDNTAGLGTQSDMTKEPDTITIDDSDSDDGSLFGDPIEESDEDPAATDKKGKGKANVKMSIDEEFDEDFDEGSDGDSDEVNQTPMTQARNLSARDLKGMDAPEAMSCTLLPHQRIGLEWLLNHETGPLKGSCLADDMGLGKTIQALALIHANPPRDPERCKTTLIVAPLALLQQWPREIADKTKPGHKLSVHVFHGRGREINRRALMRYDVVLTNYDTLCAEYGLTQTKKKGLTLLHPDTWFHRVILDEAHKIKNRRAQTSQGAWRLQTDFRLCMTGTPMMNDPEELYGIVRFLQLKDYSDWSYFDARIAKPLGKAKDFGRAPPEEAMREVRKVVDMTMLVRKKTDLLDGKPMITLPGRTDTVEYCIFDEDEQAFYDKLEEKTQKEVAKFQKAYKGTANFAVMLVQLLRMRQACCHPILLAYGTEKPTTDGGSSDEDGNPPAAAAKKPRGKPQTKNAEYYREIEDDYLPSAKIKKTLEILANIREKSPEEKVIVFSFFTSFLDILAIGMAKEGFVYRRYDGTLNVAKKDVVIRDFIDPNSRTRILLTSLQSVSHGLLPSISRWPVTNNSPICYRATPAST